MESRAGEKVPVDHHGLNPYESAPEELKQFWKTLKFGSKNLDQAEPVIIDFEEDKIPGLQSIPPSSLDRAFRGWLPEETESTADDSQAATAFHFEKIPGLIIIPALLPRHVQRELARRLLLRDLSTPAHQTNLHAHYNIHYPDQGLSFFDYSPHDIMFEPKDPAIHKPLRMNQVLNQKLRWMTLGGQYDWTKKKYPDEVPPEFPEDLAHLIHEIFPGVVPQAAIVNVYSPGDTLSMHRDVSEEADRGLVSLSLGCDCIFAIGIEDKTTKKIQKHAIRLRSGDAVYMTGESRFAWHGVPQIVPGTCPHWISSFPKGYLKGSSAWNHWMGNKRINLNIRQMYETTKDDKREHTLGSGTIFVSPHDETTATENDE